MKKKSVAFLLSKQVYYAKQSTKLGIEKALRIR